MKRRLMNDGAHEVKMPRGETMGGRADSHPSDGILRALMNGIAARLALLCLLVAALAVGACRLLLPERYAVNAPLGHLLFGRGAEPPARDTVQELLSVPEGFAVELWVAGLPNARFLRFTPMGDLLVSTPRSGRILLVERDADGDNRPDGVRTLLEGLDRPHGLDLQEGWLYVGETGAIARVRFDAAARRTQGPVERIVTDLPSGGNHWTRTIRFGPDGLLYVSVGSSCNVCIETDPRRATVLRFRPDGSHPEIFATGLRNSVGFDWRPDTGKLYATDNGRDLLGDDFPPCELNRIEQGGFYGWPFANGDRLPDPDLGAGNEDRIAASIPPVHEFRAHNAPLGMTFLREAGWPAPYQGAALAALHGSWNRTRKDGYEVVSLHWRPDGKIEERPFLTGFLRGEQVIGRPVDVAEGPDGSIYVSDDYGGAIYRVRLANAGRATADAPAPTTLAAARPDPLAGLSPTERSAARRRGAALYETHRCAGCHEIERADPGVVPVVLVPERLRSRYDVASLGEYLLAPTPPMPAVPLEESARRDLAFHLLARDGE
jgi:glucose/arabinose dehydrogenase